MEDFVRQQLEALPDLKWMQHYCPPCKICGSATYLFDVLDFNKFCSISEPHAFGASGVGVKYFCCAECDCIFTDLVDDWTEASFRKYIYNEDYVKVDGEYVEVRPKQNASVMRNVLAGLEQCRILDYGSGTGVFGKEMAKYGFANVECYDPFSSPVRPTGKFDIVSAFEVIEHSPSPLTTFDEMLNYASDEGCVIFSQAIQPLNISTIKGAWWYLAPRNGHVTTYSEKTLYRFAKSRGITLYKAAHLHGFSKGDPGRAALERVSQRCVVKRLTANASRQFHDEEKIPNSSLSFRWTGVNLISWEAVEFGPGQTLIEIPFALGITPFFASQCIIRGNGNILDTFVRNSSLVAITDFKGLADISLQTPPCCIPFKMSGVEDDRELGLAILTS